MCSMRLRTQNNMLYHPHLQANRYKFIAWRWSLLKLGFFYVPWRWKYVHRRRLDINIDYNCRLFDILFMGGRWIGSHEEITWIITYLTYVGVLSPNLEAANMICPSVAAIFLSMIIFSSFFLSTIIILVLITLVVDQEPLFSAIYKHTNTIFYLVASEDDDHWI